MTIDEQAAAACDKWIDWVVKEGGAYWRHGDIADEDMAEWIPGYLLGVQHRLSNVHGDDVDHERLWHFGEDMLYFKQVSTGREMAGKCHAAGYVAGYQSIGGKHDNSNDN
jgi:hypothetical protein